MHRLIITSLALMLAGGPAAAASLGEAGELESARANARAGGPISERDAELLQRYGFHHKRYSSHAPVHRLRKDR
jgi:hypothetical protein